MRPERFKDWLARGVELELWLAEGDRNGTRSALRQLLAAWCEHRNAVDTMIAAATLVRRAAEWVAAATLMDLAGWALGPERWSRA